jgi:hypothetical protein
MPIHDWTKEDAGTFHNFHESWITRLVDALNAGRLPSGHFAMADQRVEGWEPDVITMHSRAGSSGGTGSPGGLAVAERPPKVRTVSRFESEAGAYARRANRIVVKHKKGNVVSVIEIISPGNKDRAYSVNQFVEKVRDLLRKGVHVLFVDLFPPGTHDPHGLHAAIWDAWSDAPDDRPADEPLTAASYDAGNPFLAYVEPLAPGDPLPEMPLFLEPGIYIPCPLDESYTAAWNALPMELREGFVPTG